MKNTIQIFALVALLFGATIAVHAQFEWNTTGNNITGTEWFGADASSTIPIDIRHRANFPIAFSTNNIERMRLMEYGNFGVGIDVGVRPKFMSILDNNNASLLESSFFSKCVNFWSQQLLHHR